MKRCPKCATEYADSITLCPADGVVLEMTGDSLLGQVLAGKYRIDDRLNEGGMGTVYRATHVLMEKIVAIKVLRPSLAADEKVVARFSREARAASRISHPNALVVTDFGEAEGGIVFLVMEYLQGKTLKEIVRDEGPMRLSRVVEIMKQVGGALTAAHEQGVVHRDLKSDNIMLLTASGSDYAKVLDFGIAKIRESEDPRDLSLTAPEVVIGTPQYMSTEQCSQAPDIDARSDIYSLGVILYEMLVGHVPYGGDTPTSVMLQHLQAPVPSLSGQRDDLPAAVGDVVSRAMAKRREDRYQSVGQFVDALVEAAETQTPPAVKATGLQDQVIDAARLESPRETVDDISEETVVRPRPVQPVSPTVRTQPPVPVSATLNPWRIIIPSIAGLLVIFAVIYAFTRNSKNENTNQSQPTLVADPNSQPVEPTTPATGKNEEGIPSGVVTHSMSPSVNANVGPSPSPSEQLNSNIDTEETTNDNKNSGHPAPTVAMPSPSLQVNTNEQPPPPAPQKPSPASNPTLPPARSSPVP